jgi:tRNA(Ile)-lysidine synthase
VSGGVDSVVLLHLLSRLGYHPMAVHVNYGLRGAESDADEAFVSQLCRDMALRLHIQHYDTRAFSRRNRLSTQVVARDLRYALFEQLAQEEGIRTVAVGHHRDDQVETLLLNLFRGTGPEGLAGMSSRRRLTRGSSAHLIRPLLCLARGEIEAYARAERLAWRTDSSNETGTYRRTVLRTRIMPVIEAEFGAGVGDRIAGVADRVRDYVRHSFRPQLRVRFASCSEADPAGGCLDAVLLSRQPTVWRSRIVLEALQRWIPAAPRTAAVAAEVERLLQAQPGRRVTLGQGAVWRERDRLRFVRADDAGEAGEQALMLGDTAIIPAGNVYVGGLEGPPASLADGDPLVAYADADALSFPLHLRPWRSGDRIQPLGMAHSKRVSDVLTDAKVDSSRRRAIHVLTSDDRVVWIVGVRLAHDARVRQETRRYAKMTFLPAHFPVADPE